MKSRSSAWAVSGATGRDDREGTYLGRGVELGDLGLRHFVVVFACCQRVGYHPPSSWPLMRFNFVEKAGGAGLFPDFAVISHACARAFLHTASSARRVGRAHIGSLYKCIVYNMVQAGCRMEVMRKTVVAPVRRRRQGEAGEGGTVRDKARTMAAGHR